MIEMVIESVGRNPANPTRMVVLREKDQKRYLVIVIGIAEADSIAIKLHKHTFSRPLTHDLLSTVIETLGATVVSILINDLADRTYYARIVLDHNGRHVEIDARPSDAIALAVRVDAPILVAESVLEVASFTPAEEEEGDGESEQVSEPDPELEERLGLFREFINSLDADDMEKPKQE
ncbi:MAG: bifunctional nuclease family protein [Chloroflexota bacterium]|nr:bifunctional nuclease family protein [Chloroflexota bacterium]MDE2840422.1 bifunctional nuclease family protein [Chloroflexota bacterium]MDE2932000.1 bifunctional nuclease family protein [Chloroflexota bacterium]